MTKSTRLPNRRSVIPIRARVRFGIGALLAACSLSLSAQSLDLQSVLERSGVSPPARVEFQEERHSPLFAEPLRLSGYLEYLAPGMLRKVVQEPFHEAFLIEGGQVALESAGEQRKLPAAAGNALETILGAIEAILSGDYAQLESVFDYALSGTNEDWTIELEPRSRRIARHLPGLTVSGDEIAVSRMTIDLRDGEWHVMEILRQAPPP